MSRYFEAPDGYDEPTIWARDLAHPDYPQPVLSLYDLRSDHRELWPAIVTAVTTCQCPTDAEIDAAIAANYRPAKPEGDDHA